MQDEAVTMRDGRLAASVMAVAVALLICLHQRHFAVSLTDPMSFVRMLRHKCGMVMAGAVVWAVVEMAGWVRKGWRGRRELRELIS